MGQRLNVGPKGEHETFERANASSREPDPAERVDNDDLDERGPGGAAEKEHRWEVAYTGTLWEGWSKGVV